MTRVWVHLGGAVVAVALVALASVHPVAAIIALALAVGLTLLVALGPDRLGMVVLLAAMACAPVNSVRPLPSAEFLTFSDVFFAVGATLLVPTILRRRVTLPVAYVLGSVLLLVVLLLTSVATPDPATALFYGLRLVAAAVLVPLVFLVWAPRPRLVDALAWAYVGGQVFSTGYALIEGKVAGTDRFDGLTTHYNFFGLAGLIATCLLIHLFHRTTDRGRLLVAACAAATIGSVVLSGSRAALLVVIIVGVAYPLLERSVVSAYVLIAGSLGVVLVGDRLLAAFGSGSAIERLVDGDETTSYSDNERREAFDEGWADFLSSPIYGHGFDETALLPHNVYLQVAVGVGVIGLVAFLLILSTTVLSLVGLHGELRRLGYAGLGYAGVALLTNSLWDRFVWMGLALAVLASAEQVRLASTIDRDTTVPVPQEVR